MVCKESDVEFFADYSDSDSEDTEIAEAVRIIKTEPGHEKMCFMSYANNKGADQPAHPCSLISAFIVRCLDSVMSLVSVTKISSLMLASDLVGNSGRHVFS